MTRFNGCFSVSATSLRRANNRKTRPARPARYEMPAAGWGPNGTWWPHASARSRSNAPYAGRWASALPTRLTSCPSVFLGKVGSGLQNLDGLVVITKEDCPAFYLALQQHIYDIRAWSSGRTATAS
jgi:hypothetical protein